MVEILKVVDNTVYAAPKNQLLNSFKKANQSFEERLANMFSDQMGVVMEAGSYLTNVYNHLIEKYPDHTIVFRKDNGSFIQLYYEKARHICGGIGTKSGVKFTSFED
jgi:hypothetical protein